MTDRLSDTHLAEMISDIEDAKRSRGHTWHGEVLEDVAERRVMAGVPAKTVLAMATELRDLRKKLEAAQAYAAERVAEQRAHAAAARAETTQIRAKLAQLELMTPLDGDARRHLVDKLDEQRWQMERELAEALGVDASDRGLEWTDLLALLGELRNYAAARGWSGA